MVASCQQMTWDVDAERGGGLKDGGAGGDAEFNAVDGEGDVVAHVLAPFWRLWVTDTALGHFLIMV